MFGENFVEIQLVGDSFEECAEAALKYCAGEPYNFYSAL